MNKVVFGFIGGFAAGAVAGYLYAKKKLVVDSDFIEVEEEEEEEDEEDDPALTSHLSFPPGDKPDILSYTTYAKTIKENEYSTAISEKPIKAIYVIEPDQFGQFDDYSTNYLTLYSDGYLVPDDDELNPLSSTDEQSLLGGVVWKTHFGEYEDGVVHIRNDILRADYEIAESLSPYHDPAEG